MCSCCLRSDGVDSPPEGDGVHGAPNRGNAWSSGPSDRIHVLTAGGSSFTITGVASGGNANFGPRLVTPEARR